MLRNDYWVEGKCLTESKTTEVFQTNEKEKGIVKLAILCNIAVRSPKHHTKLDLIDLINSL